MFTTEITRSGELTLLAGNKYLHSKYNPQTEADTFIVNQKFKCDPVLVIIIGAGLGYLKKSVTKKYLNTKVLSIFMDKDIYKVSGETGKYWFYNKKDLKKILADFIPDFLILETSILKWKPCTNLFPERTKKIEQIIYQFFLERKGSIFTIQSFGRKWIRNFFLNYSTNKSFLKITEINIPVIIAASGPSLNKSLELLRKYRKKFMLAALPSSLAALKSAGIDPDIVFNSDPGFWTGEHFKHLKQDIPIVMPLSASFNSNHNNPVVCISQNTFLENIILQNNIFPTVYSHGTVAGTAYLFLRKITDKPIIFTGLDFSFNDIHEHVKPHSFDFLFRTEQNRFNTELYSLYNRKNSILGTNSSGISNAFSTYAGWFNNFGNHFNVFRLNPGKIETTNIESIDESKFLNLSDNYTYINTPYAMRTIINNNSENTIHNGIINILKIISNFEKNVPQMDADSILSFFTGKNYLNEIFQFINYTDIINLARIYRKDKTESKKILLKISANSYEYFNNFLLRFNNE